MKRSDRSHDKTSTAASFLPFAGRGTDHNQAAATSLSLSQKRPVNTGTPTRQLPVVVQADGDRYNDGWDRETCHIGTWDRFTCHTDTMDRLTCHIDTRDRFTYHTDTRDRLTCHIDTRDRLTYHTDTRDRLTCHIDTRDRLTYNTDTRD